MASTPKLTQPSSNKQKECRPAEDPLGNIVGVNQTDTTLPLSVPVSGPDPLDDEIEQGSSGDEWGMEIGNLIIDLDADLEKDEMKEKIGSTIEECKNSNNNNSTKGSAGSRSPACNSQDSNVTRLSIARSQTETPNTSKSTKTNYGNMNQNSVKIKSKSKKSLIKTGSGAKLVTIETNVQPVTEAQKDQNTLIELPDKSTTEAGTVRTKFGSGHKYVATGRNKTSENNGQDPGSSMKSGGKFSKSGRGSRKQGKHSGSEKKYDTGSISSPAEMPDEELREKSLKASKNKFNAGSSTNVSSVVSVLPSTQTTLVASLGLAVGKYKGRNSQCSNILYTTSSVATSANQNAASVDGEDCTGSKAFNSQTIHSGSHRKTSSMPAPMKPLASFATGDTYTFSGTATRATNAKNSLSSAMDLACDDLSSMKRVRNPGNNITSSSVGNKKIKLDKEGKPYAAASEGTVLRTDGASHSNMLTATLNRLHHSGTGDSINEKVIPGKYVTSSASSGHRKALVGNLGEESEQSASSANRASVSPGIIFNATTESVVKSTFSTTALSTTTQSGSFGEFMSNIYTSGSEAMTEVEQEGQKEPDMGLTPAASMRSVGTVTMYADVGVTTEPESLGPCEPGTSVHLDGIVWHETESGVLIVNVTWRNKSYVGTLLDATKHDWAPPSRIPDADSDVELRAKSGRPKRQRGGNSGNGSGGDGGRKGKKSTVFSNSVDDYKNSPTSNKRRCVKVSESDTYSGNDGEICTTPSKSGKLSRMSVRSTTPSKKQKYLDPTLNAAKELTSGEGTSGSGSSTCSSPVLVECPHVNCKKKYNNTSAWKYHEAHAHCSGGAEADRRGQDMEFPLADSPKDSDNMSMKSVEEVHCSDFPTSLHNIEAATMPDNPGNSKKMPEHESSATHVPFVVAQMQPKSDSELDLHVTGQPVSKAANLEAVLHGPRCESSEYDIGSTMFDGTKSTGPDKGIEKETEETVSPYALTDIQTNESISLKVSSSSSECPRETYNQLSESETMGDSCTPVETANLVDSESAQAVKTLLQLQDNQDQLPGLSHYQVSQPPSGTISSQSSHTTLASTVQSPIMQQRLLSASIPASGVPLQWVAPQPQTTGVMAQTAQITAQYTQIPVESSKAHGCHQRAPLPHMAIGISSDQGGLAVNSQYVVSVGGFASHAHGTVTTNPSQEGGALYTSSGVKMAKGKTVPIPTDPLQTQSNLSQVGTASIAPGGSAGKKQKKKKPKTESGRASVQSPTESTPIKAINIGSSSLPGLPSGAPVHVEGAYELNPSQPPRPYSAGKPPSGHITPTGLRKLVAPETESSAPSRTPSVQENRFNQSSVPNAWRQCAIQSKLQCEETERVSGGDHPGNMNNNNKQLPSMQQSSSPAASDGIGQTMAERMDQNVPRRRLQEGQSILHIGVNSGSSQSLPGSRSLTPVAQPLAAACIPHAPAGDTDAPKTQAVEPTLPHPGRSHSQDGNFANKRFERRPGKEGTKLNPKSFTSMQHVYQTMPYHGYVQNYDLNMYQAKYMNDPQFQQHYESVIQREMQKDLPKEQQKIKEEQGLSVPIPKSPHPPGPSAEFKLTRPKLSSPSPRPGIEDRPRRAHPQAERHFDRDGRSPVSHGEASSQIPANHTDLGSQLGTSPTPSHGSYLPTPRRTHFAAPSMKGLSPNPHATPPPIARSRQPRPSSETEKMYRRELQVMDRHSAALRASNPTSTRKPGPDQQSQSPEKQKSGQFPPSTIFPSPGIPGLPPGAPTQLQYYGNPYSAHIIDPRSLAPTYGFGVPPAYAVYPPGVFSGQWPVHEHGSSSATERPPLSPHAGKPVHERSSGGSRSPYREEGGERSFGDIQDYEPSSYSSSKERRSSAGSTQLLSSVTPDTKSVQPRNSADVGRGSASPPTQRHHHTHHHIHEGFPLIPHQYPFTGSIPIASVMAGTEAAAALAQFPKREIP